MRERLVAEEEEWEESNTMALPNTRDVQGWDRLCFSQCAAEGAAIAADSEPEAAPAAEEAQDAASRTAGVTDDPTAATAAEVAAAESTSAPHSDSFSLSPDGCWRYPAELHDQPWTMSCALMSMDQVHVVEVLRLHIRQLEGMTLRALTPLRCQWLFALASKLEKPIHGETAASFRSMLRHFASWRSTVTSQDDAMLPYMNVMISIAGAYFGQDEQLARIVSDFELF